MPRRASFKARGFDATMASLVAPVDFSGKNGRPWAGSLSRNSGVLETVVAGFDGGTEVVGSWDTADCKRSSGYGVCT